MPEPIVTIGIDISSSSLDAYSCASGKTRSFAHTEQGRAELVIFAREENADLIAFEATGGYEKPLAHALRAAGLTFACVNPTNVRHYAKAVGVRAKTDAVDARVIAEFAATARPEADKGDVCEKLAALVRRRKQLIKHKTAEEKRLKQSAFSDVTRDIEDMVHLLCEKIADVEARIAAEIDAQAELQAKYEILTSIKGCGPALASCLLALLPELGNIANKSIAALTGLAPYNRDSGAFRGKRFIGGGRSEVRQALYMAAVVASRHNPDIRDVYQRLIKAGKPAKVALTACMRKLLILANALVRDNRKWREDFSIQPN